MASHHFLGTGRVSEALRDDAREPDRLLERGERLVHECGLEVVARQAVPFPGGGLTLVWVLAESHLVLHHWPEEGYATIDLHVCDYHASNAAKARSLSEVLARDFFADGTAAWRELELQPPQ